jgi:hypothetical protein
MPTINGNWQSVACDLTGQYLVATAQGQGGIWRSTDGGQNWSQTDAPYNYNPWGPIASNSDGTKLVAAIVNGSGGIWTYGEVIPPPPPPPPPPAPICFLAGTPILTDQGLIHIEEIEPAIHTIDSKRIVTITQTISTEDHLICFEKHSLGLNYPNKKTIMSQKHQILYNGQMYCAESFVNGIAAAYYTNIYKVEYNGEILYNVLMENHDFMNVNNLIVETLNPENIIAKLYYSNYSKNKKEAIVKAMYKCIEANNMNYYLKICSQIENSTPVM